MKRVAIITDATSPEYFFPAWHRYYGSLFGTQNLHVVTYAGMKEGFRDFALGNLWGVNAAYDDTLRAGLIGDLVAALLRSHDVVIRCDVDEFLIPDSARFTDLADFVERNELPYVTAQGIDVIELAEEAELDLDAPIFGLQRRYGVRATALNKTCVTSAPLRWAEGFHGASAPPIFAGLYLLHLKFADIKKRLAWYETMRPGLVPGSKAHQYFSATAEHLTGVQNFLSGLAKGGLETEAEFNARFLATVHHNQERDNHQGDFFTQDFLIPLLDIGIAAPGAVSADAIRVYNGLLLTDPPADEGLLKTLEAPKTVPRQMPQIAEDLSGRGLGTEFTEELHVHGSYLVQRRDAVLFGPNNLVAQDGGWSCESRGWKQDFLDFYQASFYDSAFPGPKLKLQPGPDGVRLDLAHLTAPDLIAIYQPVFLATPLEPANWGRWLTAVTPKIAAYKQYGGGRKFLCHVAQDWQKAFLRLLGVPDAMLVPHDPGRTYILHDVMAVEFSQGDPSVSMIDRGNFFEMVARYRGRGAHGKKLFVSRLTRSRQYPDYRVLQNEAELAAVLERMGFAAFEPELFPLEEQIARFAAAEQIVFLGGAAIFNAVFCAPDTSVVTIESGNEFAQAHTAIFSLLGLRHGVIFGREDDTDPASFQRRWTVDVARAGEILESFFAEA